MGLPTLIDPTIRSVTLSLIKDIIEKRKRKTQKQSGKRTEIFHYVIELIITYSKKIGLNGKCVYLICSKEGDFTF